MGGVVSGVISGAGSVIASNGAEATWTGANTYSGPTSLEGTDTVLTLSGSGTLGDSDGTTATQTRISGAAQLALNSVAVGDELLYLDERNSLGTPAHLTSSGASSWAGNIKADIPGTGSHYKIATTSGTLTLSGTLSAWDETAPNDRFYVFDASAASNINVTGSITDLATDANGDPIDVDMNNIPDGTDAGANVHVVKRGDGTLTISTGGVGVRATDILNFHRAATVIEQGTLAVVDSQTANAGELFSSTIDVRSGAFFDTSAFTTYGMQIIADPDDNLSSEANPNGDEIGQRLTGAGTINTGAGTLRAFEDTVIAPGDSGRGTLTVNGNLNLTPLGANPNGRLEYELGATNAIGGANNDLIDVNGTLNLAASGGGQHVVQVTPAAGNFGAGAYTLITADARTGSSTVSDFAVVVVNEDGDVLNTRQTGTVALTGNNVTVSFAAAAARTWNGSVGNNTWDVGTSTDWTAGDNRFRDLDTVTFGAAGTLKTVVVNDTVTPGSTTFNSANTYTFTGDGGISGTGAVNVNAGVVKFQNAGNDYSGTTTVASTARLEMDTASTGSMVINGTLAVGSTGLIALPALTYFDANHLTNTTLAAGGALVPAPDIWEVRDNINGNSNTIYEADAAAPATAPEIRTTISGLSPNTAYTVYANFWDATGASWQIQAGEASGNLTLFANPADNVAGATAAELSSSFIYTTTPVNAAGNRTMFNAPLGQITTDGSGNLVVFVDDFGGTVGDDRTFYDGLSYVSGPSSIFGSGDTLNVNGDVSLNVGSTLELDLGRVGFDSLNISGAASLLGTIDVSYLGDAPDDGAQFAVLTAAGGISTPLGSLNFGAGLPDNFAASYNDAMTQLILTYSAGVDGDFNGDGFVDAADYTRWRDNLGAVEGDLLSGNGNGGTVDSTDYDLWKASFGNPAVAASGGLAAGQGAVPEPHAGLLLAGLLGLGVVAMRRQPRWRLARCVA